MLLYFVTQLQALSSFLLVLYMYMYITTGEYRGKKYCETSACEIVNYKSVHMGLGPSQLIWELSITGDSFRPNLILIVYKWLARTRKLQC
jgi:hypothetical protein